MARQATAWRHGGRGRGRGSNGRGRGGYNSNKNKEKEMKFATQDQMTRGYYSTYSTIKDTIVIEVQKKYEYGCDIASAIRTGKRFDLKSEEPKLEESTDKDDT